MVRDVGASFQRPRVAGSPTRHGTRSPRWSQLTEFFGLNETGRLPSSARLSIKSANFGPEFKKVAIELYWDDLKTLSPDAVAKLRQLLTK